VIQLRYKIEGGDCLKKFFSVFLLICLLFTFSTTAFATSSNNGNALYQGLLGVLTAGSFLLLGLIWRLFAKIMQKPNEKAKKVEEELLAAKKNVTDERLNTTRKDENIIVAQSAAYKNNFCRKCGAELLEESKFCHKCGAETILEKNKVQS